MSLPSQNCNAMDMPYIIFGEANEVIGCLLGIQQVTLVTVPSFGPFTHRSPFTLVTVANLPLPLSSLLIFASLTQRT